MNFSDRIKAFLLARFIPQRTMIGLTAGALVVTGALDKLVGSAFCSGPQALEGVCSLASQALTWAAPWLVIIGVTDRDRK